MQNPNFEVFLKNLEELVEESVAAAPTPSAPAPAASAALALVPEPSPAPPTAPPLRFLLASTHCNQVTGYSKVSHGLLKVLATQPHLEVIHYGFQKFIGREFPNRTLPPSVRVIDAGEQDNGFNYSGFPSIVAQEKPDIVMIYNDMIVISNFITAFKTAGVPLPRLWLYVDQVYPTQLMEHLKIINDHAERVFAFTPYWAETLKAQGITKPIGVIKHGFDQGIFHKIPRQEARKRLALPESAFIITSLNRNQPRKRLDLLVMAFVELIVKHPQRPIFLLMVCDKGERGGWRLFEIYHRELVKRRVPVQMYGSRLMITNHDMMYSDEEINSFYNAADIGISCADGEGFGLCTFEQMGLGVPQVVPDIGGYKEFCTADNSQLVKPTMTLYLPIMQCPVAGEAAYVAPKDVCCAIENYLFDSELRAKHGAAAERTVKAYTWETAAAELVTELKKEHEKSS